MSLFEEIFDKNKKYVDLVVSGKKPNEALEEAFGKEIADETIKQLDTMNKTTNN